MTIVEPHYPEDEAVALTLGRVLTDTLETYCEKTWADLGFRKAERMLDDNQVEYRYYIGTYGRELHPDVMTMLVETGMTVEPIEQGARDVRDTTINLEITDLDATSHHIKALYMLHIPEEIVETVEIYVDQHGELPAWRHREGTDIPQNTNLGWLGEQVDQEVDD